MLSLIERSEAKRSEEGLHERTGIADPVLLQIYYTNPYFQIKFFSKKESAIGLLHQIYALQPLYEGSNIGSGFRRRNSRL